MNQNVLSEQSLYIYYKIAVFFKKCNICIHSFCQLTLEAPDPTTLKTVCLIHVPERPDVLGIVGHADKGMKDVMPNVADSIPCYCSQLKPELKSV